MIAKAKFTVNHTEVEVECRPGGTLLDVLKHELGIVSVKRGCETGECGACTVLLDGKPVNSCLIPLPRLNGITVTTLEGLGEDPLLQELQNQFIRSNAFQCGFCTPGMLVTLSALLRENGKPNLNDIKTATEGNLCRCGAYLEIEEATLTTIGALRKFDNK